MKPLRIAFAAKQRSGKDCAADFILRSYKGQRKAFADPLYDLMYMIQDFTGLPRTKDRLLLQLLGTEWGRNKNQDIWLDKLFSTLDLSSKDNIIITDARFKNEFLACKKNGFILIKIEADDTTRIARGADIRPHASEIDMDEYNEYDYVIENNGTIDEFYTKLLNILSDINGTGKFIPNCS